MKQTYLHKGGLKPGTYFLIGKDNKVKSGNLLFERIIGDFLVAKGLATTEDNCTYVLDCCTGIDLSYNEETGELCVTFAGEEICVTLDGITTVSVNNALTGNGTVGNPVQWGGDLVENTTIEGNNTYPVTIQNLTQFLVTTQGVSAGGTLRVSGAQSLPAFLRHRNVAGDVWTTIDLDFNDVSTFGYQDSNGLIGFRIFPAEDDSTNFLGLRTKAIRDATAVNGQVPILTDDVEGIFEWGDIGSSITFPGPYDDDTAAGVGGVAIGRAYELSAGNIYGMAEGVIKVRKT